MITKLEGEAEADATEKGYCDEEMAKTESKKADLEPTVENLTTKIDQAGQQGRLPSQQDSRKT